MPVRISTVVVVALLMLILPAVLWAQATYPDDIKTIVEQLPGSEVLASAKNPHETNAMLLVPSTPLDDILEYYRKALEESGWEMKQETDLGSAKALEYKKGEQTFLVTVVDQTGAGQVMITLVFTQE